VPHRKDATHDLLPTLEELISRNRALCESYYAGIKQYPDSVCWRFPIALSWRLEPLSNSPEAKAALQWLASLSEYQVRVRRYFVDWLEAPWKFEALALGSTLALCADSTKGEQILQSLDTDFQTFEIELKKQGSRLEEEYPKNDPRQSSHQPCSLQPQIKEPQIKDWVGEGWPQRLRAARSKRGQVQKEAAAACSAPLETYKKWEARKNPRRPADHYLTAVIRYITDAESQG
jgi:hypothetical protein